MSLVETERRRSRGREIQRTPLHLLMTSLSFVLGFLLLFSEDALESDDELELDEDDELFFFLMGGTIGFLDELSDEDDDDDDVDDSSDSLLSDPLGGPGSVFLPWVLGDGIFSSSP